MIAYGRRVEYENSQRYKSDYDDNLSFSGVIGGAEYFSKYDYKVPSQLYIYSKNYLVRNKLKFVANLLHEDNEFTAKVLVNARKVFCYRSVLYHHIRREGTITSTKSLKRCEDLIKIVRSNKYKLRSSCLRDIEAKKYTKNSFEMICYCLNILAEMQDIKAMYRIVAMLDDLECILSMYIVGGFSWKSKLKGVLIWMSPFAYCFSRSLILRVQIWK